MNTLVEQERKLMDLLTRRVHQTFADARAAGVPAEVFDEVESIARSMTAALPTNHVYDRLIGPFYDTNGPTQWWGVSRKAVDKAVAPVPPQQNEQPTPPAEKKQSNKPVTVYISQEVYTQARLAFNATRTVEADRNWSQFVEKAVAGEIRRRAERHNGGEDFEGIDAPLSPGRPLSDH
ncbi:MULTISPECIES: ParB family protein [Rhodococcus]|uniref:ParB family protein n=1 Tax=Rhodococcus TaxID=1827 RepID=UPI000B0286AA|nr:MULTISPECIES: hypothetical protein [Rhodococcus]MCE4165071.1 hypothetical protein [Rhodococcus sp. Ni2]